MENLNSLIWSDEDSINTSIDPRPMQEKCLCGFCTVAPGPGEGSIDIPPIDHDEGSHMACL